MKTLAMYRLEAVRESSFKYHTNVISSPEDAYGIVAQHFHGRDREVFSIMVLNVKNRVIGIHDVSVGSLTASIVHPREVFKSALLMNGAAIILAHCHPSGDPTPSKEDISITERLVKCGRLMDIPVLDHIITGVDKDYDKNWVSMKEQGLI